MTSRSGVEMFQAIFVASLLVFQVSAWVNTRRVVGRRAIQSALLLSDSDDSVDSFGSLIPIESSSGSEDSSSEVDVDLDALSAESASKTFEPKTDISDLVAAAGQEQDRRAPRQAKWLPMLLSPPALDGSFAGDVGFDPLGFASDKATLIKMRDAGTSPLFSSLFSSLFCGHMHTKYHA